MVTYDWKDYRHNSVHKQNTMHAVKFLHLFSMHILPPAFVRIRHYGLLSPSNRDKVRKVQAQLGGYVLLPYNSVFILAFRSSRPTRRPL